MLPEAQNVGDIAREESETSLFQGLMGLVKNNVLTSFEKVIKVFSDWKMTLSEAILKK